MYLLNSNLDQFLNEYDKEEIQIMKDQLKDNIKRYFKQRLDGINEN